MRHNNRRHPRNKLGLRQPVHSLEAHVGTMGLQMARALGMGMETVPREALALEKALVLETVPETQAPAPALALTWALVPGMETVLAPGTALDLG